MRYLHKKQGEVRKGIRRKGKAAKKEEKGKTC